MAKRLQYIDACKGAGILLVILGHVLKYSHVRVWIYSFHMPLFFFLSGYVLSFSKDCSLKELAGKRLKSLMVPYFSFAVFFYVYWAVLERRFRPEEVNFGVGKPLIGILYGVGVNPWMTFNSILWFLPCLFLTTLLFAGILRAVRSPMGICSILTVSSLIGYLVSVYANSIRLPWGGSIVFTSVVFFGLGYLARAKELATGLQRSQLFVFALIALFINIPLGLINKTVDMNYLTLGNYFLYYTSALAGIVFMFLCSVGIRQGGALSFCGRHSLIIMCVHSPVLHVAMKTVSVVSGRPVDLMRDTLLGAFACFTVTLAISIACSLLVERYLPFVIGKSTADPLEMKDMAIETVG